MLKPIIPAALSVSHQVPSAEAAALVVPALPGNILAKAEENVRKMKAAAALSMDSASAIVSEPHSPPVAALPAVETTSTVTVQSLVAQMNATTDETEKYKLAAAINKLEGMGSMAAHKKEGLPALETTSTVTIQSLVTQMNATTDETEKYKLAAAINKLEGMG